MASRQLKKIASEILGVFYYQITTLSRSPALISKNETSNRNKITIFGNDNHDQTLKNMNNIYKFSATHTHKTRCRVLT